jgi:glucose/mannose-6-phosphate isomerase
MNLDDLGAFRQLDSQGMLAQINGLPEQLEAAYELGALLPLPECDAVDRVLVAGTGTDVAGPDLLAAWAEGCMPLPITLHTGGDFPFWARGPRTLVIAVTGAGGTPGTRGVIQQALDASCPALVLRPGRSAAGAAQSGNLIAWDYPHAHSSCCAVGWTFGLLHSALFRLGWLPDPQRDLPDSLHAMRNAQMHLLAEVPVVKNPAKRLAGQMVGRWMAVFTSGFLAPVARRWKSQLNLLANTWAQVELLPEAKIQALAGLVNPARPFGSLMALFLRAPGLDAPGRIDLDFAREFVLQQGINTDFVDARGPSRFAQIWTSVLFADYTAAFLALAYGIDPSPVAAPENSNHINRGDL